MSLATKYRPTDFEAVCGQSITVDILNKQIENKTFKNCYLFSGKSGAGKTTIARIFANKINDGVGSPIELDCASQNSVDNIRAITEAANQRSLVGEYKIFILDECHMLSNAAWNAMLKCIEEPPKYTIFIFCTTDPQKIPATILNRVQRYNFAAIDSESIKNRLLYICNQEGFTEYEPTCDLLSKTCFGSMRDAITNLEQIADYSHSLNLDVAKKVLGGLSYETMFKLTWALKANNEAEIFNIIETLYSDGQDLKNFINNYLSFILDLNKYILFKNIDLTAIPTYLATDENPVVQFTVEAENSLELFNKLAENILDIKTQIKYDSNYKATISVMLLKAAAEINK